MLYLGLHHVCKCTYIQMYTCIQTHTQIHIIHTHEHTRTHMYTYACTLAHRRMDTHRHRHTCTHTQTHAHRCMHTHTHTRVHTYTPHYHQEKHPCSTRETYKQLNYMLTTSSSLIIKLSHLVLILSKHSKITLGGLFIQ